MSWGELSCRYLNAKEKCPRPDMYNPRDCDKKRCPGYKPKDSTEIDRAVDQVIAESRKFKS